MEPKSARQSDVVNHDSSRHGPPRGRTSLQCEIRSLPRLMLVSDAPLSRNGLGIDRTLFALFEHYPEEKFVLYTRGRFPGFVAGDGDFIHRGVAFPCRYVRPVLTRFANVKIMSAFYAALSYLDFSFRAWATPANVAELREFDPQLVILCPNGPEDMLEGYKALQHFNCPFVVYLMDDWAAKATQRWLGGKIQTVIKSTLREANAWITVSEKLSDCLSRRYGVKQKRVFTAHNTVDVGDGGPPDFAVRNGPLRIVYAGSIWPMHYDAVIRVAEGVGLLKSEGVDVDFVIHCPEHFWNTYGQRLGAHGVRYGGFIKHHELKRVLQEADLLLVASSFKPEYAHYSYGSVQTKLTDYMCTGRAILSVGPQGCACNEFVERWKCGRVSTAQTAEEMAAELRTALSNRLALAAFAQIAFDTARENFDRTVVVRNLYEFLSDIARQSPARN